LKADEGQLGVSDRFFEVGGNSLRLMSVISKTHQVFEVRIPLGEVFKSPTVRGMAHYIRSRERERYQQIRPAEKKQYYPLSSAQRRIFFIQEMDRETTVYNMPRWIRLDNTIGAARVEQVLRKLIARHESLRTSFVFVDGEPVQCVHGHVHFSLPVVRLADNSWEEAAKDFVMPFDLSAAPAFRACYGKREEHAILLFDIHHIISDGISEFILERDFYALLYGRNLPEIKLQYKDFSNWQSRVMHTPYFNRQAHYWANVFQNPMRPLNLPYDFKRQGVQDFQGASIPFAMNDEELQQLRDVALKLEVTPYMLLFAVYNIMLSNLAEQPDVAVGIPIAGRQHSNLENTMGIFINTVAVNSHIESADTFAGFARKTKHNLLGAYENQDYPFDLLTEKLSAGREGNRNGPFDVMFDYHNESLDAVASEGDHSEKSIIKTGNTKFDLNLHIIETPSRMYGSLDYAVNLFEKETAEMVLDTYKSIVLDVLRNPDVSLRELSIVNLFREDAGEVDAIEFNF
jgi:fengycin family lipopeptide synthetase D